jgi:hypothetical protein
MAFREQTEGIRCRVWIVRYDGTPPAASLDVPAGAVAVEPAEGLPMTVGRARRYVEAFNRAALRGRQKVWAVLVPVTIRYEGDVRPGERLCGPGATDAKSAFRPADWSVRPPVEMRSETSSVNT